jgi:hypothetical protein
MDDNFTKCTKCGNKAVRLFFSVACDYCDGLIKSKFSEVFILIPVNENLYDVEFKSKTIGFTRHDCPCFVLTENEAKEFANNQVFKYIKGYAFIDHYVKHSDVNHYGGYFGVLYYDFETFDASCNLTSDAAGGAKEHMYKSNIIFLKGPIEQE